jgi:hypothetical protein
MIWGLWIYAILAESCLGIRLIPSLAFALERSNPRDTISCPADFIPELLPNSVSLSRMDSYGKTITVYRCNRGMVSSGGTPGSVNPREIEVPCKTGPNGGILAQVNATCVPGFCSTAVLGNLSNGVFLPQIASIAVDKSVVIECKEGFTIDGLPSGPRKRELRCDQDTSLIPLYSPVEDNDCKPLKCGEVFDFDNSRILSGHKISQEVYFGEVVKYECLDGFYYKPSSILSHITAGSVSFSFRCDSSGTLVQVEDPDSILPGKCTPANCPTPPTYDGADLVGKVTDRIAVGEEVQYVCERGRSFVNTTSTVDTTLQKYLPIMTRFRVSCVWDSSEKTGVYDTDPKVALCANNGSPQT